MSAVYYKVHDSYKCCLRMADGERDMEGERGREWEGERERVGGGEKNRKDEREIETRSISETLQLDIEREGTKLSM